MIIIREANIPDAEALSQFAEMSFRDTFTDQNRIEDMNAHCCNAFSLQVQEKELSSPDNITLLYEIDDQLVAYAQIKFGESPNCFVSNRSGEIRRFYVDRNWHGRGVAQTLMDRSFQLLKKHKADTAWLGVWEKNLKAIAFYKKFKFTVVGERMFLLGSDEQRDVIMVHQLSPEN